MPLPPLKLGFLASRNGTAMRAVVAAARGGELRVEPRLLISNRAEAPALAFAREAGLPWQHVSALSEGSAQAADAVIAAALKGAGVELVVLSGYLRRLGPAVLEAFGGRILNIHPALLPRHGGEGMYGRRVHEAVLTAGDSETGATVHLVEGAYDTGPVLAQARIAVEPGDTPESLERRVAAIEAPLYIDTLRRIASGELALPVA
ncbi:MAG TPA: phosphoribosylglycinamide formyltransferase [Caulobacteraceae bacterium]